MGRYRRIDRHLDSVLNEPWNQYLPLFLLSIFLSSSHSSFQTQLQCLVLQVALWGYPFHLLYLDRLLLCVPLPPTPDSEISEERIYFIVIVKHCLTQSKHSISVF